MRKMYVRIATVSCVILAALCMFTLSGQSQNVRDIENRMMKQADENIEQYRKGDVVIQFKTSEGRDLSNATVEISQKTHDFLFGCIIFDLVGGGDVYREDLFKRRFNDLFNFAIFPFYWPSYESRQGKAQWERMLETIEWCRSNGITTKGHPLVWACVSGTPGWLSGYTVAETEELLKARVINTVNGFEGQIDIWDVVNEPVNVRTWEHKIQNFDDENDWGVEDEISDVADYVENALIWSHSANPQATLVVNEYNTIAVEATRQRFYDLINELKSRNAPITGVGIQAHEPRQEWFPPEEVWKTFDLYAGFGFPIHITELHPQSSGKEITGDWRTGTWTTEAQAEFTEQFMRLCFGHPAVASINWWGLSDRNIWLEGGGLIDEEYQPKPAYEIADKLINEEWKTNISVKTGRNGTVNFRGFFGEYDIVVRTDNGRTYSYSVHVRDDEENRWVFTLGD